MSGRTKSVLAVLLFTGLLIRLLGVHWGLPSKSLTLASYHPDEAFVFQSLENIQKTRSLNPGWIGLHYGTFHFYLSGVLLLAAKVLGLISLGSRDWMLANLGEADKMYLVIRYFSVFCGVLAVYAVFLLGRKVADTSVGLWAAFFTAFSPILIEISYFAKLDALLPALVAFLLLVSMDYLERPSRKNLWLCGILAGLLASTRYNCGVMLLVPVYALWQNRRGDFLKKTAVLASAALIAFILTTPYALLDIGTFIKGLDHMWNLFSSGSPRQESRLMGIGQILFTFFPFAAGWPATLLFFLSVALVLIRKMTLQEKMLALSFASFFVLVSFSGIRFTYYIIPLMPAFAVFLGLGLKTLSERLPRPAAVVLASLLILAQAGYSWAYSNLYSGVNTREAADAWITKNIPQGETIGMLRSYFWTPGLLRQKSPPYRMVKGGDDDSSLSDALSNLSRTKDLPAYFLLSDMETNILNGFSGTDLSIPQDLAVFLSRYERVAAFEREPEIFGVAVWKRTAPFDLRRANPALWLYKLKDRK
ncbi:MAG: hypothetical protein A3A86_04290 [Elusimicrobia bacterium RIFCSPLOWO2_01_FULL_60_11]|nr:MAG: hypothetical protein A3A86_04290 [Elusimicrobia bacterium RIFCSPLOWO2_01_FULL_60_11]